MRDRQARRYSVGGGFRVDQSGIAILVIDADARRDQRVRFRIGLNAQRGIARIERQRVVGRAALVAIDRNPSVRRCGRSARENLETVNIDSARRSDARLTARSAFGIAGDKTVAMRLVERDHAGQRARAIRTRACAAHDLGAAKIFGRQRTPDHPIAERIVLRNAVQCHKRPARAGRRDRAQRDTLRRRIGGERRVAAKKRKSRHLFQRRIELRLRAQLFACHFHDRESVIAQRIWRARGDNDGFRRIGGGCRHGNRERSQNQARKANTTGICHNRAPLRPRRTRFPKATISAVP